MHIIFVAESGMYDYWREALQKHTQLLAQAVSVKNSDLAKTRVDHADAIIYFDSSRAGFYSHLALNLGMLNHAAQMGEKGITAMVVTKNGNPGEVVYRVWYPADTITEIGQVPEMWYAFHTHEAGPTKLHDDGFLSMDWAQFEKRFILKK